MNKISQSYQDNYQYLPRSFRTSNEILLTGFRCVKAIRRRLECGQYLGLIRVKGIVLSGLMMSSVLTWGRTAAIGSASRSVFHASTMFGAAITAFATATVAPWRIALLQRSNTSVCVRDLERWIFGRLGRRMWNNKMNHYPWMWETKYIHDCERVASGTQMVSSPSPYHSLRYRIPPPPIQRRTGSCLIVQTEIF